MMVILHMEQIVTEMGKNIMHFFVISFSLTDLMYLLLLTNSAHVDFSPTF